MYICDWLKKRIPQKLKLIIVPKNDFYGFLPPSLIIFLLSSPQKEFTKFKSNRLHLFHCAEISQELSYRFLMQAVLHGSRE